MSNIPDTTDADAAANAEDAEKIEQTDNGPRDEDGDQPAHVPADGVAFDHEGEPVEEVGS